MEHPDVPVVSFTGGTKTGGQIAKSIAPLFKKSSFELGEKNPNIIFSDCDFKKSVFILFHRRGKHIGEISVIDPVFIPILDESIAVCL